MRMRNLKKPAGLLAGALAATLVLAACGDDDGDEPGGADGTGGSGLDGATITIGVFAGWDEGVAASFLWGEVLQGEGATVEYIAADPGPTFEGVAQGDADLAFDAWLPNTHADYWEQYGETVEDFGAWYDEAPLTIAVNEDAPIQSLDELAASADAFGNRIVSIESGSGLYRITRDEVVPTYGLEDMELLDVGTSAMLQELETAINDGNDIVVTLWQPHWAYAAYPIRNLEDPDGVLAAAEEIHSFGRPGFSEDYPEAAEWLNNFKLTEEQLLAIEEIMIVENEAASDAEYEASLEQWLEENPDYIDQLKAGELG
jgi:glycine betaine/proline transport system substrate-binding protein